MSKAVKRNNRDPELPPAIFLMGATASGKTDFAIWLAEQLPCDIISVDSALVYRGMDIGTAKPSAQQLARVPHRLIDICEPSVAYSAARFREDALREMKEITGRDRVPLLVGGTMLYFRALQYGLSSLPPADAAVREVLEQEADAVGWEQMHRRLRLLDPDSAKRIHPNDPQRIQRALEVYELTGQPLSLLQRKDRARQLPYRIIKLAIATLDRAELHRKIAQRFHQMILRGFEAEVRSLLSRGDLVPEMPSMRAVGYRQMLAYLRGEYDHETMVYKGIVATRQLAKRQITWLRSEADVNWLDRAAAENAERALKLIRGATI